MQTIVAVTVLALLMGANKASVLLLEDDAFHNLTKARVESYVQLHDRQTQYNTRHLEQHLNEFKRAFHSRLDVVDLQGAWVEEKLLEIDTHLNPMEYFDEVRAFCVQEYRTRLPLFAPFRAAATACIQRGTTAYAGIVGTPTATLQNLKNYYVNVHNKGLSECKRLNPKFDRTYATCAMKTVNTTEAVTTSNTHTFKRQMESITCTADSKIREVYDCYAQLVYNAFSAIGVMNGLIDKCVSEYDFCPTCVGALGAQGIAATNSSITGRCPFQMSWHLADDDLLKSEIKNPFKGINERAPCLQINFIKKGAVLLN